MEVEEEKCDLPKPNGKENARRKRRTRKWAHLRNFVRASAVGPSGDGPEAVRLARECSLGGNRALVRSYDARW